MTVRKIESFAKYKVLLADKRKDYVNNNGYFPTEVQGYIKREKVFYKKSSNWLALFFDEGMYYQLVLYVSKKKDGEYRTQSFEWLNEIQKDIVCNLVETELSDITCLPMKLLLEEMGFVCGLKNLEYKMSALSQQENSRLFSNRFSLEQAKMEHLERILEIWKKGLTIYVVQELSREEWETIIKKGNMLVVLSDKKEICGASYFDVVLGRSTEHHIVVDKQWQGTGVSHMLLKGWIEAATQKGAKDCFCWIEEHNIASLSLHKRFGAIPTGRVSKQFLLKRNKIV